MTAALHTVKVHPLPRLRVQSMGRQVKQGVVHHGVTMYTMCTVCYGGGRCCIKATSLHACWHLGGVSTAPYNTLPPGIRLALSK